ncbi:MAG: hypothetical protein ACRD1R_03155 [Acidobacteriota bacterium]
MSRFFPLFLLLLNSPVSSFAQDKNWSKVQSVAESHYKVVMLLIEKKEFDEAVSESKKLFDLKFPKEKENLLFQSADHIAAALRHEQRFDLAHEVIDGALVAVTSSHWKAELFKQKAFTFEKEGKRDDALHCFKKAIEVENSNP